jgi:type VI secretion system protein
MRLRLSLRTAVPNVESFRIFDQHGGVIGRESGCDWVLPDRDKVVSRKHCRVEYGGDRYWFVDISANGTFTGDAGDPLGANRPVEAGEVSGLIIGQYHIDVELVPDHADTATPRSWEEMPAPAITGIPPNWDEPDLGDNSGGSCGASPRLPPPEPALPPHPGYQRPGRAPMNPGPARSPGDAGAGAAPPGGADGRDVPADGFAAFLEGAGVAPRDLGDADPAAVMRQAGAAFRVMAAGLHGLLAARAAMKHEMHIDRTTFSYNPLKTSPDPSTAIRSLLRRPPRNGMSAEAAAIEAISDIEGHEMAVTAGMNAALGALLGRFAPERLAQGLDHSSLLENLLPAARRSRYWQAYEAQYQEIIDEAECNFHRLFGEEFARVYLDIASRPPQGGRGR